MRDTGDEITLLLAELLFRAECALHGKEREQHRTECDAEESAEPKGLPPLLAIKPRRVQEERTYSEKAGRFRGKNLTRTCDREQFSIAQFNREGAVWRQRGRSGFEAFGSDAKGI